MTVETSLARAQYATNGTTGPWTVPFYFLEDEHLQVIYTDEDGNETVLTSADYSVTGAGDENGGTVTTVDSYVTGGTITILRDIEALQEVDLVDGDSLPSETLERAFDKLTMLLQQVLELAGRALVFSPSDLEGSALPAAAARASKMLGFDSSGVLTLNVPADGTAASLALSLASSTSDADGDGMIAVKQTKTGAVATTQHKVNERDNHSMHFMTASQIGDVVSSAGAYDMTAALQAGVDAWNTLELYPGLHKISGQLNLQANTQLIGANIGKTIIRGTHAGTLLYAPVNNRGIVVRDIFFQGAGCSAIKADEVTVSSLQGYLNNVHVHHCDFGWELAYGINAMMLLCLIDGGSTFGYAGNGAINPAGFVAVRSYAVAGNDVNANVMRDCTVNNAGGPSTKYAIEIYGGQSFTLDRVDFEGCGRVAKFEQMSLVEFYGCWMERNALTAPNVPTTTPHIILVDGSFDALRFRRCHITASETSGTDALIEWQDATSGGVDVEGCNIGLATATQRPSYANNGAYYGLGTAGKVRWVDNTVTGGPATNPLNSTLNKGLRNTMRGWAVVSTSAPSIDAASDGSLASVTKNATGDVTLTLPSPVGSATSSICAVGSATDSLDVSVRCVAVATNQIRVYARKAGAGHDCTVAVHWSGL